MKEARPANMRSLLLTALILSSSAFQAHAYYHPDEGRWLSRDPIAELAPRVSPRNALAGRRHAEGGETLYGFVGNRPVDRFDVLGLVCGSWWNDWFVPEEPAGGDFTSACQWHDDCYGRCDMDKASCDQGFRDRMKQACADLPTSADGWCYKDGCIPYAEDCWVRCTVNPRERCMQWAETYYQAVHKLGCGAYKAGQKGSKCCPREPPCN